jgi:hypothetical protein
VQLRQSPGPHHRRDARLQRGSRGLPGQSVARFVRRHLRKQAPVTLPGPANCLTFSQLLCRTSPRLHGHRLGGGVRGASLLALLNPGVGC